MRKQTEKLIEHDDSRFWSGVVYSSVRFQRGDVLDNAEVQTTVTGWEWEPEVKDRRTH